MKYAENKEMMKMKLKLKLTMMRLRKSRCIECIGIGY